MECFLQGDQQRALSGSDDVVFLDATPSYLRTPAAAPRVQQALPHAKFVILLRVRLAVLCVYLSRVPTFMGRIPGYLLPTAEIE
jgi:hypothetical protein